jgi:glycosyltransferase involved in cell wall biosynthesis
MSFAEKLGYEKKRSRKKKCILVVDWKVPTHDQDAGSRTNYLYYQLLLKKGFVVKLIAHYPSLTPASYATGLERQGVEIFYGGASLEHLEPWFSSCGGLIDYVYLNRPSISIHYLDLINKHINAPIVYLGHDFHYLREMRGVAFGQEIKTDLQRQELLSQETKLLEAADCHVVFSVYEKDVLMKKYPEKKIVWKPLYYFNWGTVVANMLFRVLNSKEQRNVLFVGSYHHQPNSDAVQWFVKKVLPLVRQEYPQLKLRLVGSHYPQSFIEALNDGLDFVGWASDDQLKKEYYSASLVVAPLRFGAGLKGKIVEALSYGVPVVSTSVGLEGFPEIATLYQGKDTAEAFAQQIILLLKDKQFGKKILKKQAQYVLRYFNKKKAEQSILQIFSDVKK